MIIKNKPQTRTDSKGIPPDQLHKESSNGDHLCQRKDVGMS